MVKAGAHPTIRASEEHPVKARDLATHIEELAPAETAVAGDVNGFMFGDENSRVQGVCVCWSPTREVISQAITSEANMIVCHQIPFFYHSSSPWFEERRTETKEPNLGRFKLLLQHGICTYRAHSNSEVVPIHGNSNTFGAPIGFPEEVAGGEAFTGLRDCSHDTPGTRRSSETANGDGKSSGSRQPLESGDESRYSLRRIRTTLQPS